MKKYLYGFILSLLAITLCLSGCRNTQDDPLMSFKAPKYPPKVQTENFQWNSTTEKKQELNDEI